MIDAKSIYRMQQRRSGILTALAVLVLLILVIFFWQRTSIGAAQDSPTATSTSAPYDTPVRIEEIARSQDRLVTATIGIIGVMGTVFAVLVGLNIFQTQRNFERETESIRDYSQSQIDRAVANASAQLREQAEEQAEEIESRLTQLHARLSGKSNSEAKKQDEQVIAVAAKTQQQFRQYATAVGGVLDRLVTQEIARLQLDLNPSSFSPRKAMPIVEFALYVYQLAELTEGQAREHLIRLSLLHMRTGLAMLNYGADIPEENDFWYGQQGEKLRSQIYGILDDLGFDERYDNALRAFESVLPIKGEKPSERELERLRAKRNR